MESIRRFPSQQDFVEMIQEAGLEDVKYENLSGGIVAVHSGLRML